MNIFKFLFSKVDESSNDKLGAYPEKVHVGAMPERRYLKTSFIIGRVVVRHDHAGFYHLPDYAAAAVRTDAVGD